MAKTEAVTVRKQIVVDTPIERAFTVFTERFGDFKPARERRMARESALMALAWLMTRLCNSSSMRRSLVTSSSRMAVMGTPVQRATTSSISSLVTMPVDVTSRLYFSRRIRRFSRSLRSSSE